MTPGLHEPATHHAQNITCLIKDIRIYKKSSSNNIPPTMSSDTKKYNSRQIKKTKQLNLALQDDRFQNFYFSIPNKCIYKNMYMYMLYFAQPVCAKTLQVETGMSKCQIYNGTRVACCRSPPHNARQQWNTEEQKQIWKLSESKTCHKNKEVTENWQVMDLLVHGKQGNAKLQWSHGKAMGSELQTTPAAMLTLQHFHSPLFRVPSQPLTRWKVRQQESPDR